MEGVFMMVVLIVLISCSAGVATRYIRFRQRQLSAQDGDDVREELDEVNQHPESTRAQRFNALLRCGADAEVYRPGAQLRRHLRYSRMPTLKQGCERDIAPCAFREPS